jgi:hypothetical protein
VFQILWYWLITIIFQFEVLDSFCLSSVDIKIETLYLNILAYQLIRSFSHRKTNNLALINRKLLANLLQLSFSHINFPVSTSKHLQTARKSLETSTYFLSPCHRFRPPAPALELHISFIATAEKCTRKSSNYFTLSRSFTAHQIMIFKRCMIICVFFSTGRKTIS